MLMSGHHSLLLRKERAIRFPAAFVLFTRWFLLHGGNDDMRIVRLFLSFWRDSLCLVIPFFSNIQSWKKPHKEWTMERSRWFRISKSKGEESAARRKPAGGHLPAIVGAPGGQAERSPSTSTWLSGMVTCRQDPQENQLLWSLPSDKWSQTVSHPELGFPRFSRDSPSLERELQKKDTWI